MTPKGGEGKKGRKAIKGKTVCGGRHKRTRPILGILKERPSRKNEREEPTKKK